MATQQPDPVGAGFRTSEKNAGQQAFACSKPSLASICTSRSGTYAEQLDLFWMAPEPFPNAIMGDERIRTLGDAWQHAIGNVIAAPACCPTG
jgi:hypothetical protein